MSVRHTYMYVPGYEVCRITGTHCNATYDVVTSAHQMYLPDLCLQGSLVQNNLESIITSTGTYNGSILE